MKVQCEICENEFRSKGTLKVHLGTIHGNKSFLCNICKRKYSTVAHLKNHVHWFIQSMDTTKTLQMGFLSQEQESCGKFFPSFSNLQIHSHAIHEGYKD